MLKKIISKWLTGATALGFAAGTMAAPFSVTYTDTASNSALGIISGQQATIKLVLDNGNSSAANQTWSAANLKCITFTFNSAQNLFVNIDYSGIPFGNPLTTTTLGNFTTNASGVLQTVPGDWEDDANPILNPTVTNIAGIQPVNFWFIDGLNGVLSGNGTSINVTNVANDIKASSWSNPVPATGVCAGAPPPPPPTPTQPIPTLTEWGVVVLASLLVLGAVFSLRRRRQ